VLGRRKVGVERDVAVSGHTCLHRVEGGGQTQGEAEVFLCRQCGAWALKEVGRRRAALLAQRELNAAHEADGVSVRPTARCAAAGHNEPLTASAQWERVEGRRHRGAGAGLPRSQRQAQGVGGGLGLHEALHCRQNRGLGLHGDVAAHLDAQAQAGLQAGGEAAGRFQHRHAVTLGGGKESVLLQAGVQPDHQAPCRAEP
jgi:hypothetical protein